LALRCQCVVSEAGSQHELIDVASGLVLAKGGAASVRQFAVVNGHDIIETENICKAPQPGIGRKLLQQGFDPADFSMPGGDDRAYMWKGKGLAADYARHYGEGILEVMVPKDLYQLRLQGHERPYQGGPHIEVPVPHADFDVLNNSIRRWHT
jgi:hypothetical protein